MRDPIGDPTHARRKPRWLVSTLAALALLALAPSDAFHVSRAARTEIGVGDPPVWRVARPGDVLSPGDSVRTGAAGSAELELGSRTVRLYENSVLRLPAEVPDSHGPRSVELEQGRSLFDVLRGSEDDRFEVRTREVVVSVKGTRFLVAADASAVAVFRGTVGVRDPAQDLTHEMLVRPGFSAFAGAGQPLQLELSDVEDPWEAWSGGAPAPRIERPQAPSASLDQARATAARTASAEMALHSLREQGADARQPAPASDASDEVLEKKGAAREREGLGSPLLLPGTATATTTPAAPSHDLDPVADTLDERLPGAGDGGTLGAVVNGSLGSGQDSPAPPSPGAPGPTTGIPFPGGVPYTVQVVGSGLHVFGPEGLYAIVGNSQIQNFLDHSGSGGSNPRDLGAPMQQLIQQHRIDPDDVEDLLEDLFDKD